jgi:hypothetical protein
MRMTSSHSFSIVDSKESDENVVFRIKNNHTGHIHEYELKRADLHGLKRAVNEYNVRLADAIAKRIQEL